MRSLLLFFLFSVSIFLFPSVGFSLSYNWAVGGLDGMVTRCFDSKRIEVHCEDFSEPELGKKWVEELQIRATEFMGRKFIYSYEKGIAGEVCREHLNMIRIFLQNVKEACITGVFELIDADGLTGSKWQALESRRGRVIW